VGRTDGQPVGRKGWGGREAGRQVRREVIREGEGEAGGETSVDEWGQDP